MFDRSQRVLLSLSQILRCLGELISSGLAAFFLRRRYRRKLGIERLLLGGNRVLFRLSGVGIR